MTLPTFVIIGAGRCGTTSLYQYLRQHPQVCMSSVKETNFFAHGTDGDLHGDHSSDEHPARSLEEYAALFADAAGKRAVGEASPRYLYHPGAAERMKALIPGAHLIAIFRDPVERAYSSYLAHVRDRGERRSFFDVARDEIDGRNPTNWSGPVFRVGLYHNNLARYLRHFPCRQLRLFLLDDLDRDTLETLRDICGFIGVDPSFPADLSIRYNKSGLPRSRWVFSALGKGHISATLKRLLPEPIQRPAHAAAMKLASRNLERPVLPIKARRLLVDYYRDDILRFQELIGRDLSGWLDPEQSHTVPPQETRRVGG